MTLFRSPDPPRTSRVSHFFRAPPRIPTRTDIDAVLRVTDADDHARDHLLVAVAAGTGLRVHELVALDWEQLVSEGGVRRRVHLRAEDTKGNVGGDVVLNEALRWKVARYRTWCARWGHAVEGDAPVFVSRNHRRLSVRMAQEAWRAVQRLAGIERPYPFHALRHYFGTALYRATKDLRLTQVAMRHRSASSTELYTQVGERDVEAAVERLG